MGRRSRSRRVPPDLAIALGGTLTLAAVGQRAAAAAFAAVGAALYLTAAALSFRARLPRRSRGRARNRKLRYYDAAPPGPRHPHSFSQDVKVAAAVRDGGMCQCQGCPACGGGYALAGQPPGRSVCGSVNEIQFDHVRPWTLGGPSDLDNCRTLCGPCNRAKGATILP